jgi:hypothetical protein
MTEDFQQALLQVARAMDALARVFEHRIAELRALGESDEQVRDAVNGVQAVRTAALSISPGRTTTPNEWPAASRKVPTILPTKKRSTADVIPTESIPFPFVRFS